MIMKDYFEEKIVRLFVENFLNNKETETPK